MNCIAFVYCTYLLGDNYLNCFFPLNFLFVVEVVLFHDSSGPFFYLLINNLLVNGRSVFLNVPLPSDDGNFQIQIPFSQSLRSFLSVKETYPRARFFSFKIMSEEM